jgi:hypothetical protein
MAVGGRRVRCPPPRRPASERAANRLPHDQQKPTQRPLRGRHLTVPFGSRPVTARVAA